MAKSIVLSERVLDIIVGQGTHLRVIYCIKWKRRKIIGWKDYSLSFGCDVILEIDKEKWAKWNRQREMSKETWAKRKEQRGPVTPHFPLLGKLHFRPYTF